MSAKSEGLYNEAFDYLSDLLPGGCNPTSVMCDCEQALRNALHTLFHRSSLHGCFFHVTQALLKNIGTKGLLKAFKANRSWALLTMGLPLLPCDAIVMAWNELKMQQVPGLTPEERKNFTEYKKYVTNQWIRTIGPAELSVASVADQIWHACIAIGTYFNS